MDSIKDTSGLQLKPQGLALSVSQVTEQTLRREFKTSGGQCTPLQIALRFKQQLNDPDYGSENRVGTK